MAVTLRILAEHGVSLGFRRSGESLELMAPKNRKQEILTSALSISVRQR